MDPKRRADDTKQPSAQISAWGSEATATLPQRIGESTSGLLKESFEQRSLRAVTRVLASLTTDNTKAGSSSSSTGTGESSLAFRSSSQYEQATSDQGESFRSSVKGGNFGRTHGQVAFNEFLAAPNDLERECEFAQNGPALNGDQHSDFSLRRAEDNLPQVQARETWKMQDENRDFADQDSDGAAVVALLSDPAFTVDREPSSALDLENDGEEGRDYEGLQTGKGSAKPADALYPPNPLDLVPDFGARWDSSHASLVTQNNIHERGHFLESRLRDVQPWIDILGRYHHEVWGDILPLPQEAREELRAANESQICLQDGAAIRRLDMVLQHLRNPNH